LLKACTTKEKDLYKVSADIGFQAAKDACSKDQGELMVWQSEANREGDNCGYFKVGSEEWYSAVCSPDAFYVCFGYEPEKEVVAEPAAEAVAEPAAEAVAAPAAEAVAAPAAEAVAVPAAEEKVAVAVDNAIEAAVEKAVDAIVEAK